MTVLWDLRDELRLAAAVFCCCAAVFYRGQRGQRHQRSSRFNTGEIMKLLTTTLGFTALYAVLDYFLV